MRNKPTIELPVLTSVSATEILHLFFNASEAKKSVMRDRRNPEVLSLNNDHVREDPILETQALRNYHKFYLTSRRGPRVLGNV